MRNFNVITDSWSWNHKSVILILALGLALIVQVFGLPQWPPNQENYVAPCNDIECFVELRAIELFEENEWFYREQSRTDAMEEVARQAIDMMMVVDETKLNQ